MTPTVLPTGLLLQFLIELQQDQANGSPCEALYVGTFTLADRGMVLEVTEGMVDSIVRNFNTLGDSGRIPISVNHHTGAGTLEEARAVGWIVKLFKQTSDAGRISLMLEPKWLDDARSAIEGEHFRFLSVGMMLRDKNPITGEEIGAHVHEVSLTNTPAISGLTPITLTALNSPLKVDLSRQAIELRNGGGLPNSLMERVDCVVRSFYATYPDSNETVWMVRDVATETCIVSRRNGEGERTWQVGYQMNPDGDSCSFSPMPQWTEVRQVYVPVTATQKNNSANLGQQQQTQADGVPPVALTNTEQKKMDETQIRSLLGLAADADLATAMPALAAKAAKIEALEAKVAELEQMKASAESAAAKLTTQEGQILALTQQKAAFEQETTTLSGRLQALESERAARDAKDRVDLALKNRKVRPAELEAEDKFLVKLAADQPATFDKIMSARPAYPVDLTIEMGSGAEGTPDEAPADKLFRLTDEKMAADAKINPQDARRLVLAEHPELRGAIKTIQAG